MVAAPVPIAVSVSLRNAFAMYLNMYNYTILMFVCHTNSSAIAMTTALPAVSKSVEACMLNQDQV